MSQYLHEDSHGSDAPDGRGGGCGRTLLILPALVVVAWLGLNLYWGHQERAEMRRDLEAMGVGRWADRCTNVKTLAVFSGSDTRYGKLAIPPQEVSEFLAALQASGFKNPTKIARDQSSGGDRLFPGLIHISDSWWRPGEENELLRLEKGVWYAAASTETGDVYVCKVGH